VLARYQRSEPLTSGTFQVTVHKIFQNDLKVTKLVDPTNARDAVPLSYILDNYNGFLDTNGINSFSGGTINIAYRLRQTIGSLTIQHVYGIATVTNNLGTMIINLSDVLSNDIVMVTPKDADSGGGGSGVNLFYGDKVSGAYRITHDRSGTDNTTRTFYFDIFGTL
jgi:hypothetical protein